MAKGKARGFEALMGWLSGRGVDPDQAEALLRSLPNVENMTAADLQRVIDQMNAPAPRARMENPISVEERVAGNPQTGLRPDPNIRATLQELDPEFAARIDTASPEEIMEAYRNAVNAAEGVRRGRPRMVESPVAQVAPPPVRQMELPLGPSAQEPDIRALIPLGRPGPGVPGALSGPGQILTRQLDMIPAPLRGLPAPRRARLEDRRMPAPTDRVIDVPFAPAARQADELIDGPSPGMRARAPDVPKPVDNGPKMPWKTLAGGLGLGAGLGQMVPEDAFNTPPAGGAAPKNSTTADLVEESRPAPKVEATPEVPKPEVKQGPPDYSAQARQLIARANDIQRAAGRQTPESIALIKEADKLYAMAAEGRSQGTQPAIMPVEQQNQQTSSIQRNAREQIAQNQGTDYRSQARRMMAELNLRSSQGTISQGEYMAMKRRIDQLFALADAEQNARPTPKTGGGMGRAQLLGNPQRSPAPIGPARNYPRRSSPSTT
jgi:hypothetical protein